MDITKKYPKGQEFLKVYAYFKEQAQKSINKYNYCNLKCYMYMYFLIRITCLSILTHVRIRQLLLTLLLLRILMCVLSLHIY
jgi:hypothetical protein